MPRMLERSSLLTLRAISSWTRKLSARLPSKVPDQRCASLAASINSAVTRTRLPWRRTEPSTICRTPRVSAICGSVSGLFLSASTEVREITLRLSTWASWLMISSVMPSPKYSSACVPPRLSKGRMATDAVYGPSTSGRRRGAVAAIGEHEGEEHDGEESGGDDPATDGGEEAVPGALVRGRRGQSGHRGGEPRKLGERAAQILGQLAGGLIAVLRLLHQTSADHRDDGRRHVRSGDVDQRRIHREMLGQHALEAGARERHPPGEHLVEHASQAVDVAAAVHRRRRGRLLRAHVGRGADGEARPR